MDCRLIAGELVAYHFGAAPAEVCDRIDAHLLECSACLRAYLAVKRHADGGAVRPRDEVKQRLRAEVEKTFRRTARGRIAATLKRPIPLYQGLFVVALVLLAAVLAPLVSRSPTNLRAGDRVDTSRPLARSFHVY